MISLQRGACFDDSVLGLRRLSGSRAPTHCCASSMMLCLVTPGRMMPSSGGVASSSSVN